MSGSTLPTAGATSLASPVTNACPHAIPSADELHFYSGYGWVLNPILSLRTLFERLRDETALLSRETASWMAEERKTNIYVLAGAITCTVDDYLGQAPRDLEKLGRKLPRLRPAIAAAQCCLDAAHLARTSHRNRQIARWRERWTPVVDRICEYLLSAEGASSGASKQLSGLVSERSRDGLPDALLDRPMRIPSGFRSQDLSHHDAVLLAELFDQTRNERGAPVIVLGPRTMGSYLAPPLAARLRCLGWPSVNWCTARPKSGLSAFEKASLRRWITPQAHVLIVDESPNSGDTFRLAVEILQKLGVNRQQIHLLVALHPTRPDWRLPPNAEEWRGVSVVRLEARELFKERFLRSEQARQLVGEYFVTDGHTDVTVYQSDATRVQTSELEQHFKDGFRCRTKCLFDVDSTDASGKPSHTRVLAKSVGWGWLGYHAFLAGERLRGYVPRVYGLRNGLLLEEWVEEVPSETDPRTPPPERLGEYVAARAGNLRLGADPCFDITSDYRWTGWRMLIGVLKNAYGFHLGRLKTGAIHRALAAHIAAIPCLTDGHMKPADWKHTADNFLKVDFEHHNFGWSELYIVDPVYDLAGASFEFDLDPAQEARMLERYRSLCDDFTADQRILMWKLVCGVVAMTQSEELLADNISAESARRANERWFQARQFLAHNMSRFNASLLPPRDAVEWTRRLFLMDLDGVFESNVLCFPQTTRSGLLALHLLQQHGFAVVLNTARSVKDVRQYCRQFGLPGGMAESGCIFLDEVRRTETVLASSDDLAQMSICRTALQRVPGVLLDPDYQVAIRAFRRAGRRFRGLDGDQVRELLASAGLDHLRAIPTAVDTTVVPKAIDKGIALTWLKKYLKITDQPVLAMGDHDQDCEMLSLADRAFAPNNCSQLIRELAAAGKCTLTRERLQRGLLEVARRVVRESGQNHQTSDVRLRQPEGAEALILRVTNASERRGAAKLVSLLNRRSL